MSKGDMTLTVYKTESELETLKLGEMLAKNAYAGEIITLDGDLGSGKTVFAKGFARGLGIDEPITSPTFTIVREYESGRLPLYHFDVYRIDSPDEMYEVGFDDYLFGNGVCIIEWAENIREILPENIVRISIKRSDTENFDARIIELENPAGEQ